MPPEFWIWAAWKDKGSIGWLPLPVRKYYLARGWSKAPATWLARYWIHKGISVVPTRDKSKAQYVLFGAQDPLTALAAPSKYTVALSADHAFRYSNLPDIIAALRFKGHRVAGWCDCRPAPDGTPATVGVEFVREYGLDYFIGQAESPAEFDQAMSVGAEVVVGNLTILRSDQVARTTKDVLFIQEDFWNEGWQLLRDDRVAAVMHGIYPAAWDPGVADYIAAGRWQKGDGAFHTASIHDYQDLP